MRRAARAWMVLPLLAALAMAAGAQQKLSNHVRAAVTSKQASYVSSLADDETMDLSIVLPLRNQSEFSSLIARLYDPTSTDYRHFLSVADFTTRFGPTQADYQSVVEFAKSNGFTVTSNPANRLVVPIHGTVAQVNAAFNVRMSVYRHPTENRTFYSPDREPSLSLSTTVAHIAGMNNYALPRPTVIQSPNQTQANVTGSGPGGSYLGSDMRAAYYGDTTLDGNGQTVGILSYVGYDKSDVDLTFSNAGQSYSVPITDVLLDSMTTGTAYYDSSEPVLDIVQAIGMAPGLSAVRMYIGNSDVDILNSMASENLAKVLTCSWSWYPDDPTTDEPIFQEFAAQGQTFLVASGDDGAFDPSYNYVVYPQEDPYVTAVGGTHMATVSAGGAWSAESAWNAQGYGSSGGISPDGLALPSYQSGIATAANGGSTTLRNVPDVAMEGDFDNYYCNGGGCSQTGAGTSFAAPRWAGFIAMVNQQAVEAGNAPAGGIGFINPALYSVGTGSSYSNDFHDITSGNNHTSGQSVWYSAVTGYDLVTGFGSPTGQKLIDALAGAQTDGFWLEPSVSTVSLTPGKSGTTTITIADAGSFTGEVTLAVSGLPSGVTAAWSPNPATGTSVLTLTADSSITTASTTAITITGTSGSLTASTKLSVAVHLPSFTLSTSSTVDLGIGSTASTYVYITPLYGFSNNVTFTVSGLPTGVTATFTPNPATGVTELNLAASSSAVAGTSTVTITGTSGSLTATASLALTVHTPTFTLQANSSADLGIGNSTTDYIYVNDLYGFSGNVTLSVSGLPAGVTASFSGNPTAYSSVLTLAAGSTAIAGTYNVTITGTSGKQTATTTLALSIHQPSFTIYGASTASLGIGNTTSAYEYVSTLYGFTGNVTFSVSGLPSGVTASFSPNPTTYSTQLILTASSAATAGTYTLTVTGTSGSITSTDTLALTVGQPSFSLSGNTSLDIGQGSSGQGYVYVQDTYGFTGSVALSASGLPTGAAIDWNPNPTSSSSNFTITAASSTATGQYPVTITGTSGSQSKTMSLTLGVHTPAFTLSSYSATLGQGSSTSTTVSITQLYGFTGSVSLAVSGLPSGVTAAFVTNPATSYSTLTFLASSSAAVGQYTVTVTGTSGSQTTSTTLTLTVATPSFTLSSYGGLSLGQGSSASTTVYINQQNGFSSNVALSVSGLPNGVTAAFGTNPATTGSTLTFTASSTAATGQYTVTVTGISGSATSTTTVTITIYAPYFTLSTNSSVTIGQGTSTTASVYVSGQYGFTGSVALSLSGLPDGVTATFSTNPTTGSSTITFTATSAAALGQYAVTLTAVSGTQTVTAPITLGVYVPSFSIWEGTTATNIGQGSSSTTYYYVTDNYGYSSPVTFSVSGLPSGVTASFSTNPATTSTALTLTASSTAAIGTSNLTITGTSGTLSSSVNLSLGIYAPGIGLSSYPTALVLSPSGTGTSSIYVSDLYGFTGSATLSASGLPTGVTVTFGTNPTSYYSLATFTVASNAPASTSTVTITGVSGSVSGSTPILLSVNAPGFTLADSPGRIVLTPGESVASTVSITPLNSFSGNVTLAVSGLPTGVTATVSPSPATSTATVTLTAASTATAGSATATITGTSGTITSTIPLAVVVASEPASTSTSLAATAGGSSFTTAASGTAVTLTATVTSGSTSLGAGQVLFCESSASVCDLPHSLGAAQLSSTGKAVLRFIPAVGSHSILANFAGYTGYAASTSSAATFQITASTVASTTALSKSGSASDYTLTALVSGAGAQSPTGTVSFLDTTSGSTSIGTATLGSGSSSVVWSTAQTPATGNTPIAAATADFNGDGIPDLAIVNNADNTVSILLGNGDGTFTAASAAAATGGTPSAVVAADFNRDGKMDLAVANSADNTVTILLGNGSGTFTAASATLATGATPTALALGDFNGDGLLDLAAVNSGSGTVSIFLGNGEGTFTAASQTSSAGSNPVAAAVGDFNGDGIPDLAVANFYLNTVTILLGNGDGSFSAGSTLATGSYPRQIGVADLNADGKQDLIVLCSYNSVDVFLGNGDGSFGSATVSEISGSPLAFALADFNNDGELDLAVTSSSKAVTLLLGNGAGAFTADSAVIPATGTAPAVAVTADFNGDGRPDLAVVNMQDNTASVITPQLIYTASASVSSIAFSGSASHTVQASYPGDSAYKASTSTALTLAGTALAAKVGVSPSVPYVSTAQALTVTVSVAATGSGPTPSGSVTLASGSYSAQQTLSGGKASFTIPAGDLSAGTVTLNASYTPDTTGSSYYTASTGVGSVTVVTTGSAQPTIAVTSTPAVVTDTESTSITVVVSGSAGSTPTGSVTLIAGGVSSQQSLSGGLATFTLPAGTFSVGTQTLAAYYSGDGVYNNGSATGSLTVAAIGLAVATPQSISPGASATATVTLAASSTFSGSVQLSCSLTQSPTGAQSVPTCSLNPASVTLTAGGSGSSTLTIHTTAASTAMAAPAREHLWRFGLGAPVLAVVLLFGIPARRRRWLSMLVLLAGFVLMGGIGCGGGGSTGGGGTTTPATTAGSYTFTVTAAGSSSTVASTVVVTVN